MTSFSIGHRRLLVTFVKADQRINWCLQRHYKTCSRQLFPILLLLFINPFKPNGFSHSCICPTKRMLGLLWVNSLLSCFCCCLLIFFKIYFFKKILSGSWHNDTIRVSNGLDSDQEWGLEVISRRHKSPLARKELRNEIRWIICWQTIHMTWQVNP